MGKQRKQDRRTYEFKVFLDLFDHVNVSIQFCMEHLPLCPDFIQNRLLLFQILACLEDLFLQMQ
jgi:hypothetical protein